MLIPDTCQAIYNVLQPTEMPNITTAHWEEIEEGFRQRLKFPNCIGAMDGKHIVIQCPPLSTTEYYNYKGTYSMNLMAMVDHQY